MSSNQTSGRNHQRFIPTVITKYTFIKVAGNDGAIFLPRSLECHPQAETGHSLSSRLTIQAFWSAVSR